jgi:hypothetical protein
MTESERKGRLKDLFELLENDMASLYPRFPDQAIYALGDPRVTQALGKLFEQDVGLENITRLPYCMETGLNALSFEFTPHPTADRCVLVIMDGNCRVAGVMTSSRRSRTGSRRTRGRSRSCCRASPGNRRRRVAAARAERAYFQRLAPEPLTPG